MLNAISLNPKYNVSFYGNKKVDKQPISQRKLDVSIYGEKTAYTIPFAHNFNVSFTGNKTYITGHRNPDTDSICSAIAVEYLANAMKTSDKEYKAIIPGDISPETQFILQHFGIDKPEQRKDVSLTVKEAMTEKPLADVSIRKDASIREFSDLILEKDLKTASVLDEEGNLAGIVSRKSLAEFIIRQTDHLKELKYFQIPYSKIVNLLNADVITGSLSLDDTIQGDVITGAFSNEAMEKIDLTEAIVIVSDRKTTQEQAIRKGAKAIIVTNKCPIDPNTIKRAKENNVIILSTDLGHSKVTSILEQATPVSEIMSKDVIGFESDQTVSDVTEIVKNNKFGFFPVTENGKFIGIISREEILSPDNNGVILVDHNNPQQYVKGVETKDIEGIIDHHINDVSLNRRVDTLFKCTGATATLVAREFKNNDIPIPPQIAGILWAAIVSDTDKFTSVTTTELDRSVAKSLANIANIEKPDALADQILAQRDKHLIKATAKKICEDDLKQFTTQSGKQFNIAQVKTTQSEAYLNRKEEIEEALDKIDSRNKTNGSVLMITDQLQGATYLISSSKMKENAQNVTDTANETFFKNCIFKSATSYREIIKNMLSDKSFPRLSNVRSRKDQVQPFISKLVEMGT